jgi:rsbT co-antagonist protein RsbR
MRAPPEDDSIYRHFFEVSSDLFCIAGTDGFLKLLSPRWEQTIGFSKEELMSRPFIEFVHPDDAPRTQATIAATLAGGGPQFFENRCLCKDGSSRWLRWNGVFVERENAFFATVRDVTEEKQRIDKDLQNALDRFELIAQSSGDVLWDVVFQNPDDPLNMDQPVFFTSKMAELLGCEAHEAPTDVKSWMSRMHPDDSEGVFEKIRAYLSHKTPRFDAQVRMVRKNGRMLFIAASGRALWDGSGRALRMAGSLSDTSERARAEQELQEKISVIERQRNAIQSLSMPVIQVWRGVLVLPMVGMLDSSRTTELTERLLEAVNRTGSQYVILDLTGVDVVDTSAANHLVRILRAVELIGAKGMISGIRAAVSQIIIALGLDLSKVRTFASLHQALERCTARTVIR